jgi:hypothetical protein
MTIEIIRSTVSSEILVVVRQGHRYGGVNTGWCSGAVRSRQDWRAIFSAARLHLRQECGC